MFHAEMSYSLTLLSSWRKTIFFFLFLMMAGLVGSVVVIAEVFPSSLIRDFVNVNLPSQGSSWETGTGSQLLRKVASHLAAGATGKLTGRP